MKYLFLFLLLFICLVLLIAYLWFWHSSLLTEKFEEITGFDFSDLPSDITRSCPLIKFTKIVSIRDFHVHHYNIPLPHGKKIVLVVVNGNDKVFYKGEQIMESLYVKGDTKVFKICIDQDEAFDVEVYTFSGVKPRAFVSGSYEEDQ